MPTIHKALCACICIFMIQVILTITECVEYPSLQEPIEELSQSHTAVCLVKVCSFHLPRLLVFEVSAKLHAFLPFPLGIAFAPGQAPCVLDAQVPC